jgi:hypothetical protein
MHFFETLDWIDDFIFLYKERDEINGLRVFANCSEKV